MSDTVSKEVRSKTMRAIRSKDTKIEYAVFEKLRTEGIRFRRNVRDLPGKPDIAVKKYKIAVFIDSCFWHGCWRHCRMPKSNKNYWLPKIEGNKKRDKEVNIWYRKKQWTLLRFWEHQITKDLESCVKRITEAFDAKKNS